jgi:hypothetical protein
LIKLVEMARNGQRVLIAGEDCGALGDLSQYEDIKTLTIVPEFIKDVRPYIMQSKAIAGLFEGTITLEARAMGKLTIIFNEGGGIVHQEAGKIEDHEVSKVVDRFLAILTRSEADIIPRYGRNDLFRKLLCVSSRMSL